MPVESRTRSIAASRGTPIQPRRRGRGRRRGSRNKLPPSSTARGVERKKAGTVETFPLSLTCAGPAFMARERDQRRRIPLADLSLASSQDDWIVLKSRRHARKFAGAGRQSAQVPAGLRKSKFASIAERFCGSCGIESAKVLARPRES